MGIDLFIPGRALLSAALKYAGIWLIFAIAASDFRRCEKSDFRLLIAGLGFTLVSDALLLFTPWHFAGVACFCGVHLSCIRRCVKAAFKAALLITISVALALAVCALLGIRLPYLLIAGALYAALIVSATACAFRSGHPNAIQIRIGMLLFVLCDINVALFNVAPHVFAPASVLMWAFYLPSQLLLSLSCAKTPAQYVKRRGCPRLYRN